MPILGTFQQQPDEVLDYDFDFSTYLPTLDTLVSVSATADAGITLGDTVISPTGKFIKQWVRGGTAGMAYKVEITATTAQGRVKQIEFKIKIREY